jgi:hypothetical protein
MMTITGAILIIFGLTNWPFTGKYPEPAIFWVLPFLLSCILADILAALGMIGIEKITKSGENTIIKLRLALRDSRSK